MILLAVLAAKLIRIRMAVRSEGGRIRPDVVLVLFLRSALSPSSRENDDENNCLALNPIVSVRPAALLS
jgi:hypothetical protein